DTVGDFGAGLGLYRPDDQIFAAFLAAASLVEHAEGFADARSVTEKHLQAAARLAFLFGLDQPKHLVGSGASRRSHGPRPLGPRVRLPPAAQRHQGPNAFHQAERPSPLQESVD